jgi:hypothetical protein
MFKYYQHSWKEIPERLRTCTNFRIFQSLGFSNSKKDFPGFPRPTDTLMVSGLHCGAVLQLLLEEETRVPDEKE